MLKMLDLFSGIGGFSLAASWTGQIETVCFVEIDPFCQKVLRKYWSNVPIIADIREVTGERIREIIANTEGARVYREVGNFEQKRCRGIEFNSNNQQAGYIDILTGGFPCQPFSVAGKRKGTDDNRFLWPEMLRVIREVKPAWVIAENVGGLLTIGDGMVFEDCCFDLEKEGYEVQPFIIPACAVNAPHRRDRVWIVANSRCPHGTRAKIGGEFTRQVCGAEDASMFKRSVSHAPDTETTELNGPRRTWAGREGFANNNLWSKDWYTVALRTCIRGMDDGLPRRVDRVNRLKALGNAIVPQVVFPIFQAIVEIERWTP